MNLDRYLDYIKNKDNSDRFFCGLYLLFALTGYVLMMKAFAIKQPLLGVTAGSNSLLGKEYLVFIATMLFVIATSLNAVASKLVAVFNVPTSTEYIVTIAALFLLLGSFYLAAVNIDLELGFSDYVWFVCWGLYANIFTWKELLLKYKYVNKQVSDLAFLVQVILFIAPLLIYPDYLG